MPTSIRIFSRRWLLTLLTVLMLLSLTACGHRHDWKEATCLSPKTCAGCGEKVGEPLVHKVPEDGVCTLCKRKLSNVLKLKRTPNPITSAVYGGVFLRIHVSGSDDVDPADLMFPGQYTIYAEDGTEMASGNWGVLRPVEISSNMSASPKFVDTKYIPLQPGNYRVEFTYYKEYWYDDEIEKAFVPVGDATLVNYPFIVR